MIVVDTNIIAYLLIPGEQSATARAAFKNDPHWVVPPLWRSELRNVLVLYLRKDYFELNQALQFMQEAELLLKGGEYPVESAWVLNLVKNSKCSAYDCEFVALAQALDVRLLTADKKILKEFPATAIALEQFQG